MRCGRWTTTAYRLAAAAATTKLCRPPSLVRMGAYCLVAPRADCWGLPFKACNVAQFATQVNCIFAMQQARLQVACI